MALVHLDFFSHVLGMDMQADVILPERTSGQIGMEGMAGGERWRVVYLLHGLSDDHTIWQRRTSIERYAARKGIAVVMPAVEKSFYTDMHAGPKWFTYVAEELPQIMRQFFPSISPLREDNFVAGLSMGGYGAMKLGLCAPERFCAIACFSGAHDIIDSLQNRWVEPSAAAQRRDVFGSVEEARGSSNDLYFMAEHVPAALRPSVYLWCGTEDSLLPYSLRMHEHLAALGYDVTLSTSAGGHVWVCWDEQIRIVLDRWFPKGGM